MAGAVLASTAGSLSSGVTDLLSVVSTVISTVTGNPILLAAFVTPVVAGVIVLVKKLRG